MKISKNIKKLLAIIGLSAFLRIFLLGSIPSGFFRDEAAIGYSAFSILKSGADEFGMRFPLVFRSFEVFFLPLYLYSEVPIVGILGLTEFSTRLLSCLSGVFAIFTIFLIAKEIWDERVGLFCSFVLAISPWHIFFSRGTFEGNLALTLFALGFYFWILFIKKSKVRHFFFSTLFFCLSMYSYQAERAVVPLFAITAIAFSFKDLWKMRMKLILPVLVIFILLIPLLSLTLKPGGYHRAVGVSVFSQETNPPGWVENKDSGILLNNRLYLRTREISSLYLSYFSPRNLFNLGDYNRQRSVENFSVFYAFMMIGLVFGVWKAIKDGLSLETKLLFSWLFFGPVPAALTGDPFHTYRSLLTFVPIAILIGYGFSKFKYWQVFLPVSFIALSFFVFNYGIVTQIERAHDWDYGYKQMVEFVNTLPEGTRVVVDDPWTEGYIHFLFFNQVNPYSYQKSVAEMGDINSYYYSDSKKVRPNKVGMVEFRDVDWPKERGDSGTVFVMWNEVLPDSEFKNDPKIELLHEIKYPDGETAFKMVKVK